MIEINLLPEEYRKKEPKFKSIDFGGFNIAGILPKKLPLAKIGIVAAIALVSFHLILLAIGINSKTSFGSLSKKYDLLLPQKKEADLRKTDLELINKKVSAIDGLMVKRFSWARKLNSLSDCMTPGIWLNDLSYEEKEGDRVVMVNTKPQNGKTKKTGSKAVAEKVVLRYLTLSGYASSMGEQGTALIGKFIKSLKDNSQFFSDFSEIKLDSIKSEKFMDQEVMNFKITCQFKESE
ncbi:MAG: hypothetical protein WC738_00655 [Candidatus Omnitrophota bacterium]|jgi:hypothetical protein